MFLEHCAEHVNTTFIYTDGSKSNAGIGFGVFSDLFNRRGALPKIASNFTAELYGILAALEYIATFPISKYTIFCDAKSVLQSLEAVNSDHPLVLKIL